MDAVIGPAYVRTMAAYNAGMNRRLYAAAARLDDAERRRDRGAFWSSIHGTLNHLLWVDQNWMSRIDNWDKPVIAQAESDRLFEDFDALAAARTQADARIEAWAAAIDQAWLDEDLTWFSGTVQRQTTLPRTFVLMHLFNHQTHHRGQVHAMITAAGERTEDTDLMLVVRPPA